DRAISIWERSGTPDSPGFAAALARRASVLAAIHQPDAARRQYARALAITKRVFGAEHPSTSALQVNLARLALAAGQTRSAFEEAIGAEVSARQFLTDTLRYLPETEAVSYAIQRPSGLNLALSIAARTHATQQDVNAVFQAVAASRALVFDEMAVRRRTVDVAGQEVGDAWQRWVSARQRFANLAIRSGQAVPSPTQVSL